MKKPSADIIIPVYNEAPNILPLYRRIVRAIGDDYVFRLIFVDDGSSDATLEYIKTLAQNEQRVKYIALSRNFGHQAALKAGLDNASADCVMTLDGDLQHPPELIPQMLAKWLEGYDIVYTRRIDRVSGAMLKTLTSKYYYKLLNTISDFPVEPGTADFRLIDRKVADLFKEWNEQSLFWRGAISWVGFKSHAIDYVPERRGGGESKYTWRNMLGLSAAGIVSTSLKPLKISIAVGSFFAAVAMAYAIYAVIVRFFLAAVVPGWASIVCSILFVGGIQLIMLGVVGHYIGQILLQVRGRPLYLIKEKSLLADPIETSRSAKISIGSL